VTTPGPREPTSAIKPVTRGRGDTVPPAPPQELTRRDRGDRQFSDGGRSWIARLSGKSAYGTGSYGLGLLDAVHFFDAAEPTVPLREALLARGRFDDLFDDELASLLAGATPIERRRED
jgi:hypothetical protein